VVVEILRSELPFPLLVVDVTRPQPFAWSVVNVGEVVRESQESVPVIALLGGYGVVLMVFLFIASLYNPAVIGPFGLSSAIIIVIAVILGVTSMLSMKAYLKRKGLDISMVFGEIPPE